MWLSLSIVHSIKLLPSPYMQLEFKFAQKEHNYVVHFCLTTLMMMMMLLYTHVKESSVADTLRLGVQVLPSQSLKVSTCTVHKTSVAINHLKFV